MKHLSLIPLSISALIVSGCAGGPSVVSTAEMKATEAQKVYVEGMSLLTENRVSGNNCVTDMGREKSWRVLVKNANGCVKSQNWRGVEQVAGELARIEINSPWSAYFYSLAAERTGDLPRAVWMVDLAMKKVPGAALFFYQKGRVLWQLKAYKDSVAEMNLAIAANPKLNEAHVFLAQAYHRDLNLERAVTHYQAALNADGKQVSCLEGLAEVRLAQGQTDKAIPLLSQAVEQQGGDVNLRLKLAQASEQVEQYDQALANYRAVRDLVKSGKGTTTAKVDVNEKIKVLETKLQPNIADQKQASLTASKDAAKASDRVPASVEKKK